VTAEQQTLFQNSIHGLAYSLEPVPGWIEVKRLCLYIPPENRFIAALAWVDPDTISSAFIQEYKNLKINITPIAWGFGPEVMINRHRQQMASFDFANYQDFYLVNKKYLQPKRDEHNKNFINTRRANL